VATRVASGNRRRGTRQRLSRIIPRTPTRARPGFFNSRKSGMLRLICRKVLNNLELRLNPQAWGWSLMEPADLPIVCVVAFAAVFFLLSVLALVMHLITLVFPERIPAVDAEIVAAISSAVTMIIPGARVTTIEEDS
jgi:hypothetical protein